MDFLHLVNCKNNRTVNFFTVDTENTSLETAENKVLHWLNNNLDKLDLNEHWSCSVSFDSETKTVHVSGDEDSRELTLTLLSETALSL